MRTDNDGQRSVDELDDTRQNTKEIVCICFESKYGSRCPFDTCYYRSGLIGVVVVTATMTGFKKPQISITFYVLVILFNIASWIDLDGVWSELPLLVPQLPEGWALPSQITIANQFAVIGPFIYFIANTIKPGIIKENVAIYIVISIGLIGCVLLALFWDATVFIAGSERSVALLALSFFLAFTDNTSTIVFLSYFSILPAEYLSAYYVGEAMCGFVPSIASLIQGAGEYDCVNVTSARLENVTWGNGSFVGRENVTEWKLEAVMRSPLFSESVFFGILAAILLTSGISFTLINYHPWCKRFHAREPSVDEQVSSGIKLKISNETDAADMDNEINNEDAGPTNKPAMSTKLYVCLLLQYGYLQGARYGPLYNVQSYSLLPYGALAYSLGNRLTTVVQTLACIVALFFPTRSVKVVTACTLIGTVPAIYIMALSVMSPEPLLVDSVWGMIIILFAWLSMSSIWAYGKVGIAVLMKDQGKRHLVVTGATEVLAILVLSVLIFVLINFTTIFKEAPQCPL